MTSEEKRKLKRLVEEMVEFDNGNISFRYHFTNENRSADGWWAIG